MANVFDQFDAPAAQAKTPAPAGNVFDQFDAPAAPISTGLDVAESALSGIPRGLAETAMFPVTLSRMAEGAGNYLYNKTENGVRSLIGAEPLSEAELAKRAEPMGVNASIYGAQDKARELMNAVLHKPQTTPGKYAGTVAEFATPGGLPSRAARMMPNVAARVGRYAEEALGNVVAPAVASEAAGQATEGGQYEGLARFLGALFGNAGAAATRAHNTPEAMIRRATEGTTPEQWAEAQRLQDNTTGIALPSSESHAQAHPGSALPDLMRMVEGSPTGRAVTGPFYDARPGQVDRGVNNVLDQIAPQNPNPYTLGPQAAEAATNVIDQTRQGINDQTRPLYQAAEPQLIPQAQFAPIAADPRFTAALARLRNNAELAPDYAGMPDNSIAVVDAVSKDMHARGEALTDTANPLYGPELAGRQRAGAATARNTATQQSSEYAQALAEQEALRRTQLNPLEQGPVGKVAKATDTPTAGSAILPQNPLPGSAPAHADATRRLAAEDPATTAGLVRQELAGRYSAAQNETQSGSRESAGAKFHRSVAGNDPKQEVLDAVLRNLPGSTAAQAMPQLLEVLQATMRRKGEGSPTASLRQLMGEAGEGGVGAKLLDLIPAVTTRLFTSAKDATNRARLRGNIGDLADILTAPDAVQRTRAAADRRPAVSYPEAGLRTLFESGQTLQDPRGAR